MAYATETLLCPQKRNNPRSRSHGGHSLILSDLLLSLLLFQLTPLQGTATYPTNVGNTVHILLRSGWHASLTRRDSAATRGNILATFFEKQGGFSDLCNHVEWPENVGNTRRAAISRGSQPVELGGFEPPDTPPQKRWNTNDYAAPDAPFGNILTTSSRRSIESIARPTASRSSSNRSAYTSNVMAALACPS